MVTPSPRSQGGASEAAISAAAKGYEKSTFRADPVGLAVALEAAHSLALGLDRSVNAGEVAEWIRNEPESIGPNLRRLVAAEFERTFTASSSSEGSPGDA